MEPYLTQHHIGLRIIFRGRSSSDPQIAQLLHESEKLTDTNYGLSNYQSAANQWPKRLGLNPQASADITPGRSPGAIQEAIICIPALRGYSSPIKKQIVVVAD